MFIGINRLQNDALQKETDMFQHYLERYSPETGNVFCISPQNIYPSCLSETQEASSTRVVHRRRSRRAVSDGPQKLTATQKCDIATQELEFRKHQMDTHAEQSERVCARYRAMLEEHSLALEELKRFTYEFEREVYSHCSTFQ